MTVLAAFVALLVLADVVFAVRLAASHTSPPVASSSQRAAGTHPCNHGFYVSQAAHAKKGGKFVSGVAQSDLGKNKSCSAPLPKAPGG